MKKYFCLLLSLLMVTGCFAACGGGDNAEDSSAASDVVDSTSVAEESKNETVYHDMLPAPTDMGGRVFNIMQRWFGYGKESIDFQGEVIWQESDDGTMTAINRAKRDVVEAVQNAYNCKITGEMSTDTVADIRTYVQEDLLSGAPTIDFCFEAYYYYYAFVENGYLVDLNTLGIDFEKPWWDQNAVKDLSVLGKLYYALGDINTYDNDGTVAILFNKDLYESNFGEGSYKELYDLAAKGEWTFDVLKEKVKGFGSDNGDGVRDEFDTYGLLSEISNVYMHFVAAGEKSVDKDANDGIIFSMDTERAYNAVSDAQELYLNTNDVLVTDLPQYLEKYGGTGDEYYVPIVNAFKEGRGLFMMCALIHLPYFRDMEDDFGILPVPKYDSTQDRYYHTMGAHTASCVFVPIGPLSYGEKGQQIGTLLDALGAYSKDYLTPEYYEKQLKRGDASDPDSAEMLDIIFENRTFDLGVVLGNSIGNPYEMCCTLDTSLQEQVDRSKDLIEMDIMDLMDKLSGNG